MTGLAAWLAADRGDNATARRRYTDAVRLADRAHHPLLGSYMVASLGHLAVESGDPRQGLRLLDQAASRLDRTAPDSAQAWLASLHAVAHATLGHRAAAHTALRTVERLASRQRGEPHWPWAFDFDLAKASRYQAVALGRLGDLRSAIVTFETAPTLAGPKPRALAQLDHASVLARAGRPGAGCGLAADALRVGREYASERIIGGVRVFRATLPDRAEEAAGLDEALADLYEQESW